MAARAGLAPSELHHVTVRELFVYMIGLQEGPRKFARYQTANLISAIIGAAGGRPPDPAVLVGDAKDLLRR